MGNKPIGIGGCKSTSITGEPSRMTGKKALS
jgi:hypothetical protein